MGEADQGFMQNPLIDAAARAYYPEHPNRKEDYYLDFYHRVFGHRRLEHLRILEIGVADGSSLQMWRQYLPNSQIVGLDIIPPSERVMTMQAAGEVSYVQGRQNDTTCLARAVQLTDGKAFDIIIDDAAHVGSLAKASFDYLFNQGLAPGGLYFLEDMGTAYFTDWEDSQPFTEPTDIVDSRGITKRLPSHDYGMIGFCKQLIDELHGGDIRESGIQKYPIESIMLVPHVALIIKS